MSSSNGTAADPATVLSGPAAPTAGSPGALAGPGTAGAPPAVPTGSATADPLAALQPLRLPAEPGWWPPAPGWWWLAGLLLLLALLGSWLAWQHWQHNRYRRQALAALVLEQQAWQEHADAVQLVAGVNRILKATSLRAFPGEPIASLTGQPWVDFLGASAPGAAGGLPPLGEALQPLAEGSYSRSPHVQNADALLAAARQWVRSHRSPRR